MARLQSLKPRVQSLNSSRIKPLVDVPDTVQRKRGYTGVKDRERIRERDLHLCKACERKGIVRPGKDVDHIIPLWAGGSDEPDNKELLCDECHDAKTEREAKERAAMR
jgi:5-methylcytosine-specific restriction protein A